MTEGHWQTCVRSPNKYRRGCFKAGLKQVGQGSLHKARLLNVLHRQKSFFKLYKLKMKTVKIDSGILFANIFRIRLLKSDTTVTVDE